MQNIFYDLLKEEKAKGNTIFYSTHILNEVSKICDRVGIIRNGKLIKVEKIEDLSKKNLTFVTITSEQSKEIVKELKSTIRKKKLTSLSAPAIGYQKRIFCITKKQVWLRCPLFYVPN